ncbi:hypothetical protein FB45DRAFT_1050720 [Roridomyces roridus]|uniref:Uncharacterized protein n=1 Tax=Roridomyces roridus TaxID=1738132 RepID=A0AAD7G1M2_9AGAR|nr:hypothetical protein FB45DRAFT_1050720 [Roridomyces roridus]
MPIVSMQEIFQSFGIPPDQARSMAAHNAAANGIVVGGYYPNAQEEDDGDDDEVDILDMAEEARQKGDLKLCENTLLMAYIESMNQPDLIVVKLRCLVRLGDLYHQKEEWKTGVEKYEAAYKVWDEQQWLADADRKIHPVSFLAKWAECHERLGNADEAAKQRAKAERFEKQYASYWR